MTVHHATRTRAEKLGVILTEDSGFVLAHHAQTNRRVASENPKAALQLVLLAARFGGEYPKIEVTEEDGQGLVVHADYDEPLATIEGDELADFSIDGVFAQALEVAQEAGLDLEAEEGEVEAHGSVVPAKYRQMYAERGNPNHCGDWLAIWLDGRFNDDEGRFVKDRFLALLAKNGVDVTTGKWLTATGKGGEGRLRMNGRQKLNKAVALNEGLVDEQGAAVKMPKAFLAALIEKYGHN